MLTVATVAPWDTREFASDASADEDRMRAMCRFLRSNCENHSSTPAELYSSGTVVWVIPYRIRLSLVLGPTAKKRVFGGILGRFGWEVIISNRSFTPVELMKTIQSTRSCVRHDCIWSRIICSSRGFSSTV